MTKQELVDQVFRKRGIALGLTKKSVGEIIDGVFGELAGYFVTASSGDDRNAPRFTYPGFGTFSKRTSRQRTGRHPRTGEPITIPAANTVAFNLGREFKAQLNDRGVKTQSL